MVKKIYLIFSLEVIKLFVLIMLLTCFWWIQITTMMEENDNVTSDKLVQLIQNFTTEVRDHLLHLFLISYRRTVDYCK